MTVLLYTNGLLSLVLLVAVFTTWKLTRQVRRFFQEVAPAGALMNGRGPQPGQPFPRASFQLLDGAGLKLADGGRPELLLFVSASCPVSRKIVPIAQDFCRRENLDLLFAGDDEAQILTRFAQARHMDARRFINDARLGRAMEVDKLPSAFLLSPDGVIISRGLVNSREHLESLLNAWESGFSTVQDYIAHRKRLKGQALTG